MDHRLPDVDRIGHRHARRAGGRRVSFARLFALVALLLALTSGPARAAEIIADAPMPLPGNGPASPSPAENALPAGARYLAPGGSDAADGSVTAPWGSFAHALRQLRAGDTLVVRGGEYREQAILSGSATLAKGTPEARITVLAAPGEQPVLRGIVHLSNADWWVWDGVDVTWDDAIGDSTQHMLRFYGGVGWELRNSELSGARSYAALLIGGGASGFRVHGNVIRDTAATNGPAQDHLVYVANARDGVIERNLLVGSPNGRAVKLGYHEPGHGVPAGVVVRYNTMVGSGASNVSFSYDAHDNAVYGNVMVGAGDGYANAGSYKLSGSGNVVRDNVTWDGAGSVKADPLLLDGGNLQLDPQLDASFVPRNPALYVDGALRWGHLAGE